MAYAGAPGRMIELLEELVDVARHIRADLNDVRTELMALRAARTEADRYREALERIAEKGDQVVDAPDGHKSIVLSVSREAEECAEIARSALAPSQEGMSE